MDTYYKITNEQEIHNGFVYKDGLNILVENFNNDTEQWCVPGGFYFTTIENIPRYYSYGINIREVRLPLDDPEFIMIKNPSCDVSRANKIVLGKKYSLYDPETYAKFGLLMENNIYLVNHASEHGHIEFLDYWLLSGLKLKYSSDAMDLASENGHIHILARWKNSGLKLKYTHYAIDWAQENNHNNVVEWWKQNSLHPALLETRLKAYLTEDIKPISKKNVLYWFKENSAFLIFMVILFIFGS